MGPIGPEPLAPIEITLQEGCDVTIPWNWQDDLGGIDFDGTGRLEITDRDGVWPLITTTESANGVVYLGSEATGDAGDGSFTFSKSATRVLCIGRNTMNFYIDWSDGTTSPVFTGTIFLLKGSPYS